MEIDGVNRDRQNTKKKTLFLPFSLAILLFSFYSRNLPAQPAERIASPVERISYQVAAHNSTFSFPPSPHLHDTDDTDARIELPSGYIRASVLKIRVVLPHPPISPSNRFTIFERNSISAMKLGLKAQVDEGFGTSSQSSLNALVQQGRDYYQADQFAQAAIVWEQAASSFAARGDGLNQAMVLSNLSLAYQHLGQWSQAQAAIAKSLELLQAITDTSVARSRILAQALNTQGSLQLALSQAEQALVTWQKAEAAYRQANDETGRLKSQINQAQALKTLGFYRRALTLLTQVYQSLQQQPDSPLKAAGLRSLGSAFLLVGDVEQSRQVLQQSLKVAQSLQLTEDIGATLYDLGNTAKAGQDTKAALEYYQQAAAIATEPLVKIQAQLNQLKLLIETQQWSAARSLVPIIQSQLDNLPPSRAAIYAQIDLSRSLLKLSVLNSPSSDPSGSNP